LVTTKAIEKLLATKPSYRPSAT